MKYYVYLLSCADGSLYTGYTNDLQKRLRVHNSGRGAKYTRSRRPVRLMYAEEYATLSEALSREYAMKKLSHTQKMNLIREQSAETKSAAAAASPADSREERLRGCVPALLAWYRETARPFPWREIPTPYHIWVSEIMLQQTRIEAARPYYDRFMEALPDIPSLAAAETDRLLKLWEGLGYYSRVRNMQKAAAICCEDFGGELPASREQLGKLPGIGPYTAGAIASMAFGLPAAAVDGNVLRVLARFLADERDVLQPAVRKEAETLLLAVQPEEEPGAFNQALMELGEVVCIPNGTPLCGTCPLAAACEALQLSRQADFPKRQAKKERRKEQRTILLLQSEGGTVIRKRPARGLLAGLYELPGLPGRLSEEEVTAWLSEQGIPAAGCLQASAGDRPQSAAGLLSVERLPDARHIFTHVEWDMAAYRIVFGKRPENDWLYATKAEIDGTYPLPSAFRAFLPYLI